MADEKKAVETNEPGVVVAYVVKRYENGDVNIENADIEGTEKLTNEALYKDVEDLAEQIKYRRMENAAYRGIQRFYIDAARHEQEAAAAADPTV